ncbi:hypothetical protein [Streptomyces sp. NPDC000410]|uniref:hypothetical protein n=1 Tax=Streptomyces sp. NPDC000410 TaxID=3154254 RepID=UPI00331C5CCF
MEAILGAFVLAWLVSVEWDCSAAESGGGLGRPSNTACRGLLSAVGTTNAEGPYGCGLFGDFSITNAFADTVITGRCQDVNITGSAFVAKHLGLELSFTMQRDPKVQHAGEPLDF